ncbi:MAG: hypothetical protein AAF721_38005 [Myxococcota bacterium]
MVKRFPVVRLGLLGWVVALSACGAGAGSEDDGGHGVVLLELRRGQSADVDPFAGTAEVQATLDYNMCLRKFYARNSNWSFVGPDGEQVAADWETDLCGEGTVGCTVDSIEQVDGMALRVRYATPTAVENLELAFGPLPDATLAGCEPIARVGGGDSVVGFDAEGAKLWEVQSFSPEEAQTGQGASINLTVQAVE